MKNKNFINQSLWAGSSPNQTGETFTRENRHGVLSYFYRTFVLLFMLLTLGVGNVWADDPTPFTSGQALYLDCNSVDDWDNGVTVAAIFYYANNTTWCYNTNSSYDGAKDSKISSYTVASSVGTNLYKVMVPASGLSHVRFLRLSGSSGEQTIYNNSAKHSKDDFGDHDCVILSGWDNNSYCMSSTAGVDIYFNNANTGWANVYARIGRTNYASNYTASLQSGTKYLYKVSIPSWRNYDAFWFVNGQAETGENQNVYSTTNISGATSHQKFSFDQTYLFSTSGSADGIYYSTSKTTGLPTYTVSYSSTGNGTLTVYKYTATSYETDKNSLTNFSAISNGDATSKPTQIIKIVPVANSGYNLSELSVSGAEKIEDVTGGSTYYVTGDFAISATFVPDWALYNLSTKLADFTKVNDYEYTLSYELNETTHTNLQFKKNGTQGYIVGAEDPTSTFRNLTLSGGYFSWGVVNGVTTGSYIITIKSTDSGSSWSYKAEQKYILTYDANGATSGSAPTDANSPYAPNTAVTTANSTMTKTSFRLTGWNTQANGQGTHYDLNTPNAFNINSNMTLYAEWTPDVPSSACVAGNFGTATMTKTTAGSVTTFTYTFYDKAAGTYDFYLDNCSGSAVLKATTGITMSQTGCTSIANSGDANNYFRVVTGSAGDVTITATYNTSTKTINMDVTRVDIDAVTSGWYMIGGPFDNKWDADYTKYPLNRQYRGISNVYYRVVDFGDGTKYFKLSDGSNAKCTNNTSTDTEIDLGTQYTLTTNTSKCFTIDHNGAVYCIYDKTNNKFWVQNPTVYYTITLANGTSGNTNNGVAGTEGTITLTENLYGKLQTKQFASGEQVNISVTAQTGYVIDDITIGARSVATDVNSSSYSGNTTMPSGNATLTVTYKHNYVVTYGVGTSCTSTGSVSTSPSITSGAYVIEGTSMTFTATPNLGYKFVGWYSDDACTSSLSTDNPYTFSVTAEKNVYAKFELMDIKINSDVDGVWPTPWSQQIMSHSSGSPAVYTYSTTLTTRVTEDGSAPYNSGYHFNFLDSNDGERYNFNNVQEPTYSGSSIDGVRKTADGNPTIQFGLTHKSDVTITLTLQEAANPTVHIAADRYYDISYTSPSHGSYTIQVGDAAAVSANTDARATTTITLANTPATGYHFGSWTVAKSAGNVDVTNNQFTMPAENVTVSATFTANTYSVRFNGNGSTGGSMSNQDFTYDAAQNLTANAFTKTGYTFAGWATEAEGAVVYADGEEVSDLTAEDGGTFDLYAQWTAIGYTVVFNGNGSTGGSMANQNFTYDAAQNLTTNAYVKDGYYMTGWATTTGGAKVYDDGQSVTNLSSTSGNFDLYAKWAKSELTNLTFTPSSPAPEGDVAITPVFDHEPTGTTVICYELHSNSTATARVDGTTFTEGGDSKVHFTAPTASGTYYVKATFRAGSGCEGTVLNTIIVPIVISSDHTVTVRYMCDGVAIHAPSEVVVPAGGTLAITALTGDDVFGYSFDSWALGDGINQESVDGGTITISAFFNGVLTANYTKKNIIYFKNTLGWENVYVHLLGSSYWNSTTGTGNYERPNRNLQMALVPGTTDVYAYEYGSKTCSFVVFTDREYTGSESKGYGSFHGNSSSDIAPVVYPRVRDNIEEADYDFNSGVPMFVPLTGQSGMEKTVGDDANKKAMYYNKGYWRKYEPATGKTGYYLEVFNKPENSSRETLYRIDMTDASTAGDIFEATIDLEAGKNYGIKVLRDNDFGYTNTSGSQMALVESGTYTELSKQSASNWRAVDMQSTTAGDYTFKLTCGSDNGKLKIAVKKPASSNDYRVVYQDAAHNDDRTQHFSRTITKQANADDIVSFFIDKGNSESMKFQYISNIVGSTVTWTDVDGGTIDLSSFSDVITQDGVYNFHLHQDGSGNISVTKVEPYTGDFYIRTDAVGGTKWADYQNAAHVMAYSDFSISNSNSGEKYSHYWMKYCTGGENVKFVVANDYSAWVSDTVIQQSPEVAHIDANGNNSALVSIRFSYNMKTNVAKRTYLAASTESTDFLVLQNSAVASSGNFTDKDGVDKGHVDIKFSDKENYIYDITAKVKPNANVRVKVFAHYNKTYQNFIGNHDVATFDDDSDSKLLLSGTGPDLQTIRILYDFKTNRLVSAWQAAGTTTGELNINADLMIVREHQGAAENIILAHDDLTDKDGKITTDKRIYAVMRFNRWILNNLDNPNDKSADHAKVGGDDPYTNHHHPLTPRYQLPTYERNLYYISFPFDVNVSDIFGFGTYGTHYAIQRYDGIGRAKNGFWADSDPNWKWVAPTGKLNAHEGYVLSLSLSNMHVTNTAVWANNCSEVELYFPSAKEGFTINTKDVTIAAINGEGSEYKCTINRGTPDGDRRIKDSYWRCIGVPSFANYNEALTSDGSSATINWHPSTANEDENGTIPFIYNINWNDKSLTAYEGATFPFKAMHSYLVQYGGAIHWSNVVAPASSIVARQRNENTTEHTFCLKLMQGDTFGDQTFVRLTDKEGVTTGFDFDQDLWKQTFDTRANIYTFIGYEQIAGNSLPISEQTTVVPVGVKIKTAGDYTFSIPEGTDGIGITLVDNETGVRTLLSALDYTIHLEAGTYDQRFILEISPIYNTPTDIEAVSDQQSAVRKVMVDGILYIVKDGKLFDARGARLR